MIAVHTERWDDMLNNQILYLTLSADASPEQKLQFERMKEVNKFFGGQPQVGGEEEQIKQQTPRLKAPPKVTITTKRKKKSRKGC